MIRLTLVTGRRAALREAAIVYALSPQVTTAVILEGLPDGTAAPWEEKPNLMVSRIAPGCLCCTGNLTLRVTLNRLLRQAPEEIFISLANDAHVAQLKAFLSSPPYDGILYLAETVST